MFSTNFIFRQQENLVDNQKCQAGFRPLCNKIPIAIDNVYFIDFLTKMNAPNTPLLLSSYLSELTFSNSPV